MSEHTPDAAHGVHRAVLRRNVQRRHLRYYLRSAHASVLRSARSPLAWGRERLLLTGTALLLLILTLIVIPGWASVLHLDAAPPPLHALPLAVPPLPEAVKDAAPPPAQWHEVAVQPGQTLSQVFAAENLTPGDLQRALDADGGQSDLAHIKPGEQFGFLIGPQGELQALRFDRDEATRVTLDFLGTTTTASVQKRALQRVTHAARGVIEGSLFAAGSKAGLSKATVFELAKVFGYDIDFAQELRAGDHFSVVYDDVYRDGRFLRAGRVLAAEFVNRGKRYTAFRYELPDGTAGYFDEDGRPLRKSFLRTPVDFTRISSYFAAARMNPVLHIVRPHDGVDYAAPSGTPIFAAGDGVIRYHGWESGYGNFIVIQHNRDISTAYGHMSRFAKGLHVGSRVHQGEVIGYVGMTGIATGPHLHYEFRVDGKARNPLTVTLPKPEPLPRAQLLAFRRVITPMLAQLQQADGGNHLASTK